MAAVGDLVVGTVFQYGGQQYTVIEKRSGLGPTVKREDGYTINTFSGYNTIVTVVLPPESPESPILDRYPEYSVEKFQGDQIDALARHLNTMVYDGYELVSITPLTSSAVLVTMMKY